jgi:cell wall-associated NlpC family hydrolase
MSALGKRLHCAMLSGMFMLAFSLSVSASAAGQEPAPTPMSPSSQAAKAVKAVSAAGSEVALYAMGMIGIGYRFGGKKPEIGLDCSGMVSYIFKRAANLRVQGSAADIARQGQEIEPDALRAGDLVFFNTLNRMFSHVGIYIGEGRFVHAPSSNGKVRIDSLDDSYYAQRYHMARSYFN